MKSVRAFVGVCLVSLSLASCSSVDGSKPTRATETSAIAGTNTTSSLVAHAGAPLAEVEPGVLAVMLANSLNNAAQLVPIEGQSPPARNSNPVAPRPTTRPTPAQPTPSAPVDPMTLYRGLLGTLEPHDFVGPEAPAPPPVAAPNTAPLTGWWLETVPQREAVVVKIDNSSAAHPQVGLNTADIVIEEEVEGGITRLAAIFHTNSTVVGPVRSGRTTDIGFLSALGSPSFVYSGANEVFDALLLRQPTVANFSAARSGGFWRDRSRRAPSNLFANSGDFERVGNPPPAQFAYRAAGSYAPWPSASGISIDFGRTTAGWSWDPGADGWVRTQNGKAHNTDNGRVSATNVVVAYTEELDTGLVDSSGGMVPEFVFVGTGKVVVFAGSHVIEGRWTRPTLASPAILTDAWGQVIELNPGRTWIELVTDGSTSWS